MTDLFNETRYADEVYDKLLFTDSRLSGKEFQDCTFSGVRLQQLQSAGLQFY